MAAKVAKEATAAKADRAVMARKAATAAREAMTPEEALWAGIARATATKAAMALSGANQEAALMKKSKDLSGAVPKAAMAEDTPTTRITGTKAGRIAGRTRTRTGGSWARLENA